jgi:ATP-binding cassette subfamily F protein 3
LALALAIWTSPHLLVLDEVTTHLDFDTIFALIEALEEWEGALLVVTHDRFFMRCVVEGQSVREDDSEDDDDDQPRGTGGKMARRSPGVVYRLHNGELKKLEGGMTRYEELVKKAAAKLAV